MLFIWCWFFLCLGSFLVILAWAASLPENLPRAVQDDPVQFKRAKIHSMNLIRSALFMKVLACFMLLAHFILLDLETYLDKDIERSLTLNASDFLLLAEDRINLR